MYVFRDFIFVPKQSIQLVEVLKVLFIDLYTDLRRFMLDQLVSKHQVCRFNIGSDWNRNEVLVGCILLQVKIKVFRVNLFLRIDINNPEGSILSVPAVGVLKHLAFFNYINTHVIELVPDFSAVIFNVNKVVTSLCTTIVNANSMQVIGAGWVFNLSKSLLYFIT